MIVNFISWLWILGTAFCIGYGTLRLIKGREGTAKTGMDFILVWGLCLITVYAQFFSLFYKLGVASSIVLGSCSLLILLLLCREVWQYVLAFVRKKYFVVFCIISIVLGGLFLWLSSGYANQDDTLLYHAQAIRWLEEYGVVKGLGNLHNRFAYNSAFFSLQALYSLKFAARQSIHSLNSLAAVIFSLYGICTLSVWKKKTFQISDFLKLGILIHCGRLENLWILSSSGSDIMTMLAVLYLSSKWMELVEDKCQDMVEYGLVCLIAAWAFTLKLSAGLMILLAVYPAVWLLKERRWKTILGFVVGAAVIIFPFLARNVIISGYLLYPYTAIDLFHVDWKMPASLVDYDRIEIMAWGRGMTNPEQYHATFTQWFPSWYQDLLISYKLLFCANILCIAGLTAVFVIRAVKKKISIPLVTFFIVSVIQINMWFWSAPLVRYGGAYLLLLPAMALGMIFPMLSTRTISYGLSAIGILGFMFCAGRFDHIYVAHSWKRPQEYFYTEDRGVLLDNVVIYVPADGGCVGYHSFPGTTGESRLTSIELRGEGLKDGFRAKEK